MSDSFGFELVKKLDWGINHRLEVQRIPTGGFVDIRVYKLIYPIRDSDIESEALIATLRFTGAEWNKFVSEIILKVSL